MFKQILLVFAFIAISLAKPGDLDEGFGKIDAALKKTLADGENPDIIVTFVEGTEEVLEAVSDTRFPTREDRLIALHEALVENAETSQSAVTAFLTQGNRSFETFWVTNQIYVRDADPGLVDALAAFAEVYVIIQDEFFEIHEPIAKGPVFKRQDRTEWGILRIQAEEARELLQNASNSNAHPIIVATIDTGVLWTHEALKDNYVGEYGWFDPHEDHVSATSLPNDQHGHGTHTTGVIVGRGGIGVYPAAKWMACKGCATSRCALSSLLACGQFVACPTLHNGSVPKCAKAPHVVNNSWGALRGSAWFDMVIAAWHVAGIVPVFSMGNNGPGCGTAGTPADRNTIGVGATTLYDELASFSSLGPSTFGLYLKPDYSAPGDNIVSAHHSGDDVYMPMSGTSMASPHVAGLAALLLAYDPELTYAQVKAYLLLGADRNLVSRNEECDGVKDTQYPNYHFGAGRINAFNSMSQLVNLKAR